MKGSNNNESTRDKKNTGAAGVKAIGFLRRCRCSIKFSTAGCAGNLV